MPKIPVTIFTGYLGSGKTTILRNLIKDLPPNYSTCLLKNEFGDLNVDSLLLKESNIKVVEMINGCLCCVLVGKLQNALLDLLNKYTPKRIFIETSGSAFPASIVLEIEKLKDKLFVDGVINVVDVLNFQSYKDTSYTAKIQSQFTDLIVFNKWELSDSNNFENVLDSINELNAITPKIKSNYGHISPDLVFGLDRSLFKNIDNKLNIQKHDHYEFDIIEILINTNIDINKLIDYLNKLPKWDFFRIKGYIQVYENLIILNYVFGRITFEYIKGLKQQSKLIFIGKNFSYHINSIKTFFGLTENEFKLSLADRI